ncbi:hypothetical protein B0H10DRAFT_2440607 [Mycena sp. CBHHK59/15]|nr:hypothetical protein B0H10DRAFT_2440607 [Mycena sp. CBHHK59/15]
MLGAPSISATAPDAPDAAAAPSGTKYRKNLRWGKYVPPDENPVLNARSTAAEVPISHLKITPEQQDAIHAMYHPQSSFSFAVPPIVDYIYSFDPDSQLKASGDSPISPPDPSSDLIALSLGTHLGFERRGIEAVRDVFEGLLALFTLANLQELKSLFVFLRFGSRPQCVARVKVNRAPVDNFSIPPQARRKSTTCAASNQSGH